MAPGETENNAYANFGVTNKEHYGYVMVFSGVINYIAQLVLKKKFQSNLAKRFFDRAFITFYYNLRKLLCQQTTAERF